MRFWFLLLLIAFFSSLSAPINGIRYHLLRRRYTHVTLSTFIYNLKAQLPSFLVNLISYSNNHWILIQGLIHHRIEVISCVMNSNFPSSPLLLIQPTTFIKVFMRRENVKKWWKYEIIKNIRLWENLSPMRYDDARRRQKR